MTIKLRSIDFVFRVEQFASDCMAARSELNYTQDEVASHLTVQSTWLSGIENAREENMKMQNFLNLCNLYDLNPLDYFELKS